MPSSNPLSRWLTLATIAATAAALMTGCAGADGASVDEDGEADGVTTSSELVHASDSPLDGTERAVFFAVNAARGSASARHLHLHIALTRRAKDEALAADQTGRDVSEASGHDYRFTRRVDASTTAKDLLALLRRDDTFQKALADRDVASIGLERMTPSVSAGKAVWAIHLNASNGPWYSLGYANLFVNGRFLRSGGLPSCGSGSPTEYRWCADVQPANLTRDAAHGSQTNDDLGVRLDARSYHPSMYLGPSIEQVIPTAGGVRYHVTFSVRTAIAGERCTLRVADASYDLGKTTTTTSETWTPVEHDIVMPDRAGGGQFWPIFEARGGVCDVDDVVVRTTF